MAGKKGILRIKILGDDSGLSKTMGNVGKVAAGAFAVFAGAKVIGDTADFLKEAAAGAREDAEAKAILHKTITNLTGATEGQLSALDSWIEKTQAATGFTEEQLRPALQQLTAGTKDVGKAQDLLGVAMDTAKGRGIDFNTVALALSKAAGGNVTALSKLGIQTKDASGKTRDFAAIVGDLKDAYGGATAAAAKENVWDRLKLVFGEMKEGIGAALLPALGKLGGFITEHMPEIQSVIEGFGKGIGMAFSFIADNVLPILQKAFGWIRDNVWPILERVGKHLGEIFSALRDGDLGGALSKWGDAIRDVLPIVWEKLQDIAKAFISWIGPMIPPMLAKLGELLADLGKWLIDDALPAIVSKLVEWAKAFAAWIGPALPGLLLELGKLVYKVGEWIVMDALPTIVIQLGKLARGMLEALGTALKPLGETIAKPFRAAWDKVTDAFAYLWEGAGEGGIKGFFTKLPGRVYDAFKNLWEFLIRPYREAWTHIWDALQYLWRGESGTGGISGFFRNLPGDIISAIGDLGGKLKDFFTGLWDKIKDGVTGLLNKIASPFKSLWGLITGNGGGDAGSPSGSGPRGSGGPAGVGGSLGLGSPWEDDAVSTLSGKLVKSFTSIMEGRGSRAAITAFAKSFAGKVPYVWGGESTSGWDCSGFVGYVLSHFGIKHPRVARALQDWFPKASFPLPGDLLFYGDPAYHVAMAVGNGQQVEARGRKWGTGVWPIRNYSSIGRIPAYQQGGAVPETQFALLHGGEYVLNKDTVDRIRILMAKFGMGGELDKAIVSIAGYNFLSGDNRKKLIAQPRAQTYGDATKFATETPVAAPVTTSSDEGSAAVGPASDMAESVSRTAEATESTVGRLDQTIGLLVAIKDGLLLTRQTVSVTGDAQLDIGRQIVTALAGV